MICFFARARVERVNNTCNRTVPLSSGTVTFFGELRGQWESDTRCTSTQKLFCSFFHSPGYWLKTAFLFFAVSSSLLLRYPDELHFTRVNKIVIVFFNNSSFSFPDGSS